MAAIAYLVVPFLAALAQTAPTSSAPAPSSTAWSNGVSVPTDCSAALNGQLPAQVPKGFNFSGNVRTYYIAAEKVPWNYVPSGFDNWLGVPIQDSPRAMTNGYLSSIGGQGGFEWQKALYRGYTDGNFTTRTQQESTSGSQGPTLRAEVGDLVQVYFQNKLPQHYASIHSMGLSYSKENEGSLYANTTNGSSPAYSGEEAVPPGSCNVYKWFVTEASAPPKGEPAQAWSYHSFVNMRSDLNAGLMGPFIVYARGKMAETMRTYRELPVLYYQYDETHSFLDADNAMTYGNMSLQEMAQNASAVMTSYTGNHTIVKPQLVNMPTLMLDSESAPTYSTMNGYLYANSPPFEMCQNDKVIWYAYAFGAEAHDFHLHGNNVKVNGVSRATQPLGDGTMYALYMTADLPGVWQLVCHVNDHLNEGMQQDYRVYPASSCPLTPLASS